MLNDNTHDEIMYSHDNSDNDHDEDERQVS